MTRSAPFALAVLTTVAVAACAGDGGDVPTADTHVDAGSSDADATVEPARVDVEIRFALRDGQGNDVGCNDELVLGADETPVTLSDARFYVHDVELNNGAEWVPVALDQDQTWQLDALALLDFEDGTGACSNGNILLRDAVSGTIPEADYEGIRFTLGVPFDRNHANVSTAPAPLSYSAMFWNWQGGYKFVRIEGTNDFDGMRLHLGSTGCEGTAGDISGCDQPNRPTVTLDSFRADDDRVVLDLSALFGAGALATNAPDTPPGCMSAPDDPDCPPILEALGLDEAGETIDGQTVFYTAP